MTVLEAITKVGVENPRQLAKFFGVEASAVYQWNAKGSLPKLRVYELKEKLAKRTPAKTAK